jgi:hypothetical protein
VALDLAQDRRHRVGRERDLTRHVEAINGLDQSERGDLHEVVDRLLRALVAARELARQRQVALDQLVTQDRVRALGQSGEEEAFLACAVAVGLQ